MSNRIQKLNKLFLQEISEIINREISFGDGFLVTVTNVNLSPELSKAKIYVSIMPFDKAREAMSKLINERKKLKHLLNKKITLRKIPDLIFVLDETEEEAEKIEKVINSL